MKKIISFLLLLPAFVFAQEPVIDLSPYKYLVINNLNISEIDSRYGINTAIANAFSSKGLIIANNFNPNNLPEDLRKNPCLLLTLNPHVTGGTFFSTTLNLKIDLVNCKNVTVYSSTISGTGWAALDEGVNKVIKRLTKEVNDFVYKFNPQLTPEFVIPISADYKFTNTGITEDSIKNYLKNSQTDQIEGIYKSFDKDDVNEPSYKFGIIKKTNGEYQAIIINSESKAWRPGEIKMIIESTSIKDIYSVQYFMEDKSKEENFASFSNNLLKINFSGNIVRSYLKLYPQNISEISNNSKLDNNKLIGSGTGFIISEKGILVTNYHVISGGNKFTATNTVDGKTYDLEIMNKDEINDLAVLKIKDIKESLAEMPYTISTNVKVGQNVFTVGYPLNDFMGDNQKVTNGIINSLSGVKDDTRYYQISVPIQPGNSGGPLFDLSGGVIGITTATLNPDAVKSNIQNVNYAIKINTLQNLTSLIPEISFKISNTDSSKELPLPLLVEKYKKCIFKINTFKYN